MDENENSNNQWDFYTLRLFYEGKWLSRDVSVLTPF